MALPDPNQIADVVETVTNLTNDQHGKFSVGRAGFITIILIIGALIWHKEWIFINFFKPTDPAILEQQFINNILVKKMDMLKSETPKILSRVNSIIRAELVAAYEYIPRGTDRYSSMLSYSGRLPVGETLASLQRLKNDKTSPVHVNHVKGIPYPLEPDVVGSSDYFDGMSVYTCPMYSSKTELRGFVAFYWEERPITWDLELYYVECNDVARNIGQYL